MSASSDPDTSSTGERLIGGRYLVDPSRPLPGAGGGVPAFAAADRRESRTALMALQVARHAPPRPRALNGPPMDIEGLLCPLAHGVGPSVGGQAAYYVICPAPSGPSLAADLRPWPEAELIERVLRPLAQVLVGLRDRGTTHRGIRLDNVFHGAANRPVILGAAWAAPPAMHQPTVFEPPYAALCHPSGRGDGASADDVYALGVLLLALALGRPPMAGLDDATILHRKLEMGDFAALTTGERLPPMLADILRGMLAEDPDHRPPPALLRDPAVARRRRVAARPSDKANRPLKLGSTMAVNNRTLALAMALDPAETLAAIQDGTLMYWLRRGLGDAALAQRLEELVRLYAQDIGADRGTANALLLMRAIAAADVFMPLCWHGIALFPDGFGPMLMPRPGDNGPGIAPWLQTLVATEAVSLWAGMREERTAATSNRLESRQWRALLQVRGPAGGMPRLIYALNPMAPCLSPLLAAHWIAATGDLLPALDGVAEASPDANLLEPHVVAFAAARSERLLELHVKALAFEVPVDQRALIVLRLLTELQNRFDPGPLGGVAAWAAARARPVVERWRNKARRAVVSEKLGQLAGEGFLAPILALLDDPRDQVADAEGLQAAKAEMMRLDATLAGIERGGPLRAAIAARLGQEIAAGLGLATVALTLILTAWR